MAVGKVSDADFEAEVLKAQGPVVVDFWAEWCGPCRMIAPALDEISGAMGDKVKIVKLNVDESPKTASKYGVMSIPTLMIFKGGEMASRQVGAAPKAEAAAVDHRRGLMRDNCCAGNELCSRRPAAQPAVSCLIAQSAAGRSGSNHPAACRWLTARGRQDTASP